MDETTKMLIALIELYLELKEFTINLLIKLEDEATLASLVSEVSRKEDEINFFGFLEDE